MRDYRKDFEAWFTGGKMDCISIEKDKNGFYKYQAAIKAWEAWSACVYFFMSSPDYYYFTFQEDKSETFLDDLMFEMEDLSPVHVSAVKEIDNFWCVRYPVPSNDEWGDSELKIFKYKDDADDFCNDFE